VAGSAIGRVVVHIVGGDSLAVVDGAVVDVDKRLACC